MKCNNILLLGLCLLSLSTTLKAEETTEQKLIREQGAVIRLLNAEIKALRAQIEIFRLEKEQFKKDIVAKNEKLRKDNEALRIANKTVQPSNPVIESPKVAVRLGGSAKILYPSTLGYYHACQHPVKKESVYPYINLNIPNKNLWTTGIQNEMRGKINFSGLSYTGTGKLIISQPGKYKVEFAECRVEIDGKGINAGEMELKEGIYNIEIWTATHGPRNLGATYLSVTEVVTGKKLFLYNSEKDIQSFRKSMLNGQKLIEIDIWKPDPNSKYIIP